MPETCMQSTSFIKQTVSEKKIFKDFFENLSFLGPQQPIKISDQDEGRLKRRALLNKHFLKIKLHSMGAEVNKQLRLYRTCDFVQ